MQVSGISFFSIQSYSRKWVKTKVLDTRKRTRTLASNLNMGLNTSIERFITDFFLFTYLSEKEMIRISNFFVNTRWNPAQARKITISKYCIEFGLFYACLNCCAHELNEWYLFKFKWIQKYFFGIISCINTFTMYVIFNNIIFSK